MVRVDADLEHVLEQMRWGDILLFKCKMPHTAIVRTLTWADYDHVAVVALDRNDELVMLEACVLGVRAFPLARRVREYATHFADVIAWRRLLATRTDAEAAACRNFVESVDGKRYSYDAAKILFTVRRSAAAASASGGGDGKCGGNYDGEEAYYCSELVVALYQHCGFVQGNCRAASFWPADLGQNGVCERYLDSVALAPEVICSQGGGGSSNGAKGGSISARGGEARPPPPHNKPSKIVASAAAATSASTLGSKFVAAFGAAAGAAGSAAGSVLGSPARPPPRSSEAETESPFWSPATPPGAEPKSPSPLGPLRAMSSTRDVAIMLS